MKILLLDDDDMFLDIMSDDLEDAGHEVHTAASVNEARELYNSADDWDWLSFDLRLGDGKSLPLVREIISSGNPPKAILVVTSHHNDRDLEDCESLGRCSYGIKPISCSTLMARMEQIMEIK